MKQRIFFVLLLFASVSIQAQNQPKIDSLNQVLDTEITDKEKVDTWNLLARQYAGPDSAKAVEYTDQSIALAQKIDYPAGVADAYFCLGIASMVRGNLTQATAHYEKTLEIAEKASHKTGAADAYNGLGMMQLRQGNYPAALEYYQKAIKMQEEAGDKSGMARTYIGMGVISARQSNYDAAVESFLKSLKLREEIGDRSGMAANYGNIGAIYDTQGNYLEAVKYYQDFIRIKEELGDKNGMAGGYGNIGVSYKNQGNLPEALNYYFRALKIREEIGDKSGLAGDYNNIGTIFFLQEDYDKALEYFEKALATHQELGEKAQIADIYYNIGDVYVKLGKYPEAIEYDRKALAIREELGDKNGMASSFYSIGNMYLLEKEYAKALEYYQKALQLFEEIEANEGLSQALKGIGAVYQAQKQYGKALAPLERALNIAQEMGHVQIIRDVSGHLHQTYVALNNYPQAYKHHLLYKTMYDSLNNTANTKKITAQAMQYEFDKKEAIAKIENERRAQEDAYKLEKQQYYTYASIAGLAAMGIVAFLIFRSYKEKQRANFMLAEQNEEIRQQAEEITSQRDKIEEEMKRSEKLLLNILPEETARELKETGYATPKAYDKVTVLFTDFKGFTNLAEKMTEKEVVENLDYCFRAFDRIVVKHGLEKIKTIGDAYMCAGGIPAANETNPVDAVTAAKEMMAFMEQWIADKRAIGEDAWELRLGIHTGRVVSGVVGEEKFAYDIWGDAVNLASRMESSGEPGKINISGDTYELVKEHFSCEYRGKVQAKNKGEVDMYFVE